MARLLIHWVLLAVSIWASAHIAQAFGLGLVEDVEDSGGTLRLMAGAAALALLNATLGRLLKLLTLPLNCLTLGLCSIVVNALMLWLAASLNLGFHVEGAPGQAFFAVLVGTVLISAVNGILQALLGTGAREGEDE